MYFNRPISINECLVQGVQPKLVRKGPNTLSPQEGMGRNLAVINFHKMIKIAVTSKSFQDHIVRIGPDRKKGIAISLRQTFASRAFSHSIYLK